MWKHHVFRHLFDPEKSSRNKWENMEFWHLFSLRKRQPKTWGFGLLFPYGFPWGNDNVFRHQNGLENIIFWNMFSPAKTFSTMFSMRKTQLSMFCLWKTCSKTSCFSTTFPPRKGNLFNVENQMENRVKNYMFSLLFSLAKMIPKIQYFSLCFPSLFRGPKGEGKHDVFGHVFDYVFLGENIRLGEVPTPTWSHAFATATRSFAE